MSFSTWGPATVLLVIVAVIVVAVGGAVTVVHPETLSFADYLDNLKQLGYAIAGLGGARAVLAHAQAKTPAVPPTPDEGDAGKP